MTGGYIVNIPSKEQIKSLESGIMSELEKFHLYLLEKGDEERNIILEWLTDNLLIGYYYVRMYLKGNSREEHSRVLPLLNLFDSTLTAIIYCTVNRLKLEYTNTYIGSWKNRTDYFPYENLMKLDRVTSCEVIPRELQSNKATQLLNKAIAGGFITKDNNLYKWNFEQYTGQLLAYFCQKASNFLELSRRTDTNGNMTVSWKPFEKAFGVEKIISYKNDWMKWNTKFTPNGHEKIDKLFNL